MENFQQLSQRCLKSVITNPITKEEIQSAFTSMLSKMPKLGNVNRVAVAVSGGPDSLSLLYSAIEFFGKSSVLAISIDHDLPGGPEDENRIKNLIQFLGVPHACRKVAWPDGLPPSQNKMQLKAREARYSLMAKVCAENQIGLLLVGHHRDDDFATMFYRMGRGSGVDGLAGMKMISTLPLLDPLSGRMEGVNPVGVFIGRPFLGISKSRLLATCQQAFPLAFYDPTDYSNIFLRNAVLDALIKAELPYERLSHFIETMKMLRHHLHGRLTDMLRNSIILDRINTTATLVINSREMMSPEQKPLLLRTINTMIQFSAASHRPVRSARLNELYHNLQIAYYTYQREEQAKFRKLPREFQSLPPLPIDQTRRMRASACSLGGGIIYPLCRTDSLKRITLHNQDNPNRKLKFGPAFLIQSEKPSRLSDPGKAVQFSSSPQEYHLYDGRIFIRPCNFDLLDQENMKWTIEPLECDQIKLFEKLTGSERRLRISLQNLLATTPMTHTYHVPIIFGERKCDEAIIYACLPTFNSIWSSSEKLWELKWNVVHAGESLITSRLVCLP